MEEELKQRSVMKEEQDKMLQVLQRENVHTSEEGELHCNLLLEEKCLFRHIDCDMTILTCIV